MNKKIIGSLLLVALGTFPIVSTHAFTFDSGERVSRTESVYGDFYTAGADVSNDAFIDGDLMTAGANVIINGEIRQDLMAVGSMITVDAKVGDDVRLAGSAIYINNDIAGDLIVFGANVRIKKGITIGGDLVVMGGNVTMDGTVAGKAIINAGHLNMAGIINGDADLGLDKSITISSGAMIGGMLQYNARTQLTDLEQIVQGEVSFEQNSMPQASHMKRNFIYAGVKYFLVTWIYLIVFASLILYYFPGYTDKVAKLLIKKPWKSLIYGLATLVGIPLLALLLCITVIGIPVGLFLLVSYIFLFVFAELFGVVVFTPIFMNLFKNKKVWTWWEKLLLVSGVALLFVLISGIDMIAVFFVWGAIALSMMMKKE